MADTQSSIALNIGSQRVSMAVFEPSKSGGLVLKAYDSETIIADPATEASRPAQVGLAISQLTQRLKAGKSKVRYAVSGGSVFTRFVKLPPLGDDDIEQLVTFEAQQHVPFPLNEVVWDYEILESAGEKEVVIVAMKAESLDELNDSVTDNGLVTAEVDVAPMALYNSFRAAYPSVNEPVLLIDIGAKSTDLLYIEGKRFFTRSVNRGGVSITSAISKEYGVSFAEAEGHKTHGGLVALGGGHTEQLDETTAALATTIRNALGQLPSEIARTTNFYRSQQGGNPPKRIILAGGGANLPYTKEFFEEKLHLPVEFFNPVGAISVGKNVDTDRLGREAHLMGELIGLGLRATGKSTVNIDLVPTKVQAARQAEKQKPFYIGAAAALIVGLAAWAGLTTMAASKAKDEAKKMTDQKEQLESVANPIDAQFKKEAQLVALATQYTEAEGNRAFWPELIQEIQNGFASNSVWITDFDPVANYNPLGTAEDIKKSKSTVKAEFYTLGYGVSGLENIKIEQKLDSKNKPIPPKPGEPEPVAKANAIRLKGFWRGGEDNPAKSTLIYSLIKKLRENPQHLRFTVERINEKTKKLETVELEDAQLVKQLQSDPAESDFAAPFEIIIPLSREVPIK
jgi:type IV pilus assembly protein PilM